MKRWAILTVGLYRITLLLVTTPAFIWLLRGSILELLVAIPSHIIVRRRDECCAQFITFWGIATGISVMLLCFGPGVYFLFVERFRKLQSRGKSHQPKP